MRTTITLEDDAAAVAREYAAKHDVTLGMAVSILIRRAHEASVRGIEYPAWLNPFPYRPDEPLITTDHVKHLQDALP
jgi:hypothetical protein